MDQLEQIKSKIDIVSFISEYLPLKKAGRNYKALCPFHKEKTPSFVISPERQIWHCFGACDEGGDIFKFLTKIENIEFTEALQILAKRAGVKLKRFKPDKVTQQKEKLYEINHLASEFYHYLLTSHKIGKCALDYLTNQRKVSPKIISHFKLGYAPNLWDSLISYLAKKKNYYLQDLITSGLVLKGRKSSYDRFRNRIIFPLADHRGNIAGFSGRILPSNLPRKNLSPSKEAKYINSPETPIYHKGSLLFPLNLTAKSIKDANLAIIVEGELDVLSSYQAGITNIVAVKGSALTQNQANLLKRFCQNIALALDSDAAGNAATRRGIETAETAGLFIKIIELPFGKDPDELIKKSPLTWKKAINSSIPIYDFYLKTALVKYDPKTSIGKKHITDELLPIFAKIDNLIIKSHYIKKLATAIDTKEEIIELALSKAKLPKSPLAKPTAKKPTKNRQLLLEEQIITLFIQNPRLAKEDFYKPHLEQNDFSLPAHKKIYFLLKDFTKDKSFDIKKFTQTLPTELTPLTDRFYLAQTEKSPLKIKKELIKNVLELKKLNLKNKLKLLKQKAAKTDPQKLNQQFKKITQKLKALQTLTPTN